jgi:hypothetical protein
MPIGQQDHGGIPVAMAPQLFGGGHQPVDLGLRQVFPAAPQGVGLFEGRLHRGYTFPKTIIGSGLTAGLELAI